MVLIKSNKTDLENDSKNIHQTFVRINGLTYPLHPLQIIAWILFLLFGIIYFVFMVPTLPTCLIRYLALGITLFLYIFHFITHIAAINTNPADDSVIDRLKLKTKSSNFDRTKHAHVIENQFCYICETHVGPKSKHCSVCNKCISEFDHHCKWLNNCVGGKNYRLFIYCVISALLGCLIVFTVSIILTIAFFLPKSWLYYQSSTLLYFNNYNPNNGTLIQNYRPQCVQILWITVVIFTCILSLIAVLLLAHLLGFHLFLNCIGLSTYDFIVQQRTDKTDYSSLVKTHHQNRFLAFLEASVFVCCSKKRIRPSDMNNSQSRKANSSNKLNQLSHSMKRSQTQPNMKSTDLTVTTDKLQNDLFMYETIENISHNELINENYGSARNGVSHMNIEDTINDTEEINHKESQIQEQTIQKSDTHLQQKMLEEESHVKDTYNEEPIFRRLNLISPQFTYQNGRMSRLSFASKTKFESDTTPQIDISSHSLFVRRQSSGQLNGNHRAITPLTHVHSNFGSKTIMRSDLKNDTKVNNYYPQFASNRNPSPQI